MNENNTSAQSRKDSAKDRPGVIAPPPVIYAVFFGLGYLLERQFPLGLLSGASWSLIGKGLVGIALLIAASGILTMKRAKTHIDVYKPATTIVSSGPFRFSRNPLYLSLTILYLGASLTKLWLWPLLTLPLALLVMHTGVISREEKYLADKFGDEYLQYKARVRRWL